MRAYFLVITSPENKFRWEWGDSTVSVGDFLRSLRAAEESAELLALASTTTDDITYHSWYYNAIDASTGLLRDKTFDCYLYVDCSIFGQLDGMQSAVPIA